MTACPNRSCEACLDVLRETIAARDTRIARLEALLAEAKAYIDHDEFPNIVSEIEEALLNSNNSTGDISG